jgi:molybdenum cofactor cytidylyltransferase
VDAAHLRALADAWRSGALVAASSYRGALGVPACFDRACFEDLAKLSGDAGASQVIAAATPATMVAVDCPACAQDVDIEEDLSD